MCRFGWQLLITHERNPMVHVNVDKMNTFSHICNSNWIKIAPNLNLHSKCDHTYYKKENNYMLKLNKSFEVGYTRIIVGPTSCPGLDHICVQLGPTSPMPPSLPNLPAHTHVGSPPRSEPMWQYPLRITNIQVDITFIIPKLNGVNLNIYNFDRLLSHWFPVRKSSHESAGRKTGQWKRRERGRTQLNTNVI